MALAERRPYPVLPVLFWLGLGLIALALDTPDSLGGHDRALTFLSAAAMALGLWVFCRDGGSHRITAAGVYNFAFALFVGGAGLYIVQQWDWAATETMVVAVAAAYAVQLALFAVFWCNSPHGPRKQPVDDDVLEITRWGLRVGVVMLTAGVIGAHFGLKLGGLVDAVAFVGVVLLAVSIFRTKRGWDPIRVAIAGTAFFLYVYYVFQGFGRLTLGALGFALAIAAAQRVRAGIVKFAILVGSVPTLIVLARTRVAFTATLNPYQTPDVTGFESVASPLLRFSQLLDMSQRGFLPLKFGETFFSSAVAPLVPHVLWPGKPVEFGAELSSIFRPDLNGTGNTELALFHGEWLFNFGTLGLIVMVPVVGLSVSALSRWLVSASDKPLDSRARLIGLSGAVVAASGLVDLLWGGTGTFTPRSGERLMVLLVVFLLFARKMPVSVTSEPGAARGFAAARSGQERRGSLVQ